MTKTELYEYKRDWAQRNAEKVKHHKEAHVKLRDEARKKERKCQKVS
jgi:hypothetical protein